MLDIPKLGLDLLLRMQARVAASCESAEEFEAADSCIEGLKGLVNPQTDIKRALMANASNSKEYVRLECEVMRSLMETGEVRKMM